MRRITSCVSALAVAMGIGLSGCVDQQTPMEPEISPESAGPFFSYQPAPGFDVVRRTHALTQSVIGVGTVGPKGGKIRLKAAGIVLDIPRGALRANTEITVTAPAGDALAFTFEPHGLVFRKPATISLKWKHTTAAAALTDLLEAGGRGHPRGGALRLDAFMGVYFEGDVSRGVEPLEILDIFLKKKKLLFTIGHFSGYAVAGG